MEWEVGEKVAVRRDNSLYAVRVARVMKRFVELTNGAKFTHNGSEYPYREWSRTHMMKLTPELEAEARHQRLVRVVRRVKWEELDEQTLAKVVNVLAS